VGAVLIDTGKGSFGIESGTSEGDWLILHDTENRVLAYSLKDGLLHHRFFGSNVAISPLGNNVVVENLPGELTVYDLTTGDPWSHISLKSGAALVRFSLDGKALFVLTAEQTAYTFDIDKMPKTIKVVGG